MSMKKFWLYLLLLLPLLLALGLPRLVVRDGGGPVMEAQCPDLVQGCRVPFRGGVLEVGFSPAPAALKPFGLVVRAPGAKQVAAEFTMQGMNMGPNRYVLQRAAGGAWHGKIVLPVCVSGASNWVLLLELDGAQLKIPFVVAK